MEKMNQALERMKMLVGMEVDDEEQLQQQQESSYMDDFNRNCTLSTKQVKLKILEGFVPSLIVFSGICNCNALNYSGVLRLR